MSVYFIESPDTRRVKIGFAEKPLLRLSKIRSDSPTRLTLRAIIDGGRADEAELHSRFAHLRAHGEWFDIDDELESFIASIPPSQPLTRARRALPGVLGEWIVDNGYTLQTFGDAVGLHHSQVSRICGGHSVPSRKAMAAIHLETGGAITPNHLYGIAA